MWVVMLWVVMYRIEVHRNNAFWVSPHSGIDLSNRARVPIMARGPMPMASRLVCTLRLSAFARSEAQHDGEKIVLGVSLGAAVQRGRRHRASARRGQLLLQQPIQQREAPRSKLIDRT